MKFLTKNKKMEKNLIENIKVLEKELEILFEKSKEFNLDKNSTHLNHEKLIKTTKIDDNTEKIAEGILNHEIFLFNSLDVIKFEGTIDWNYTHPNSANTYKLYLQCLNFISNLCDAYIKTKDRIYLLKAYEILLDWIKYIKTDESKNRFKWVDHTVANRVINIIYFISLVNETNEIEIKKDIIGKMLIEHGWFLEDDKNYNPNNHGIMSDRSLILLSVFMKPYPSSERWYQKGRIRILNALYRDFSNKGVHLENSPSYHLLTRNMFRLLIRFLRDHDIKLGSEFNEKITSMNNYLNYFTKPDGSIPILGDTQATSLKLSTKSYDDFIDDHAGIAILQNEETKTWISFICGYGSKTHKHKDDLSITLHHNGIDILQDSGRYNYDSKDPIRQYLQSPAAHSTIVVENENYEILEPEKNKDNIKIVGYNFNENFSWVKGMNNAYPGSTLQRSILYLKNDNLLILYDKIKSEKEKNIKQIFNLDDEISVEEVSPSISTLKTNTNDNVKIYQYLLNDLQVKKVTASKNPPQALISKYFGKLLDTSQICYEKFGKDITFLTCIDLEHSRKEQPKITFDKELNKLEIQISGNIESYFM